MKKMTLITLLSLLMFSSFATEEIVDCTIEKDHPSCTKDLESNDSITEDSTELEDYSTVNDEDI